jgi:hypothetical protein
MAVRADAVAACSLAAGATQAAVHLVEVNLAVTEGTRGWTRRARWRTMPSACAARLAPELPA